ncbi:MAG: hypothetical protein RRZ24_08170 [Clostridia bacterium]
MEIEFDDKPRKGKAPKTRLYAQGKSDDADGGAYARNTVKNRQKKQQQPEVVMDDDGFRIRVAKDEIKPASRIGLIFCGFLFAGMVLFILAGYERISRAYADINTLNNEIELTNLRIVELDVKIECAVTIQDAQEAAKNLGMQYPEQSQYRKIGDYIPISGILPDDTAGGNGTASATDPNAVPTEETTAAPDVLPAADTTAW